jgi:hypothetical protein
MKLDKKAWDKAFKKEGKIFTKPQEDMPRIVKLSKKNGVKRVFRLGLWLWKACCLFSKKWL